jgi:hypothetical protein
LLDLPTASSGNLPFQFDIEFCPIQMLWIEEVTSGFQGRRRPCVVGLHEWSILAYSRAIPVRRCPGPPDDGGVGLLVTTVGRSCRTGPQLRSAARSRPRPGAWAAASDRRRGPARQTRQTGGHLEYPGVASDEGRSGGDGVRGASLPGLQPARQGGVGLEPVAQCQTKARKNGFVQCASAGRATVKPGASGAPRRGCGT